MEWITVRRHGRESRASRPPTELPPRISPRLEPAIIQRFILRRIRLCLSQGNADLICGFAPHTVSAIESHQLYPSTTQLVTLDAHLTVLEEIQRQRQQDGTPIPA